MDTKQGDIYPSYEAMAKEIGKPAAKARGITGSKPTLRKVQKMIRRQLVRERKAHATLKEDGDGTK